MMIRVILGLVTGLVIALVPSAVAQTDREFVDPAGKYKLTLVADWRPVSFADAVGRQKTEFVYRDRAEGLLRITREPLDGGSVAELVHREEESLRIYRRGFERSSSENFGGGRHAGIRLSFFTTERGRANANVHYYLSDGNGVWVLRFTGKRGTLDVSRNLTDQIARSFQALQ